MLHLTTARTALLRLLSVPLLLPLLAVVACTDLTETVYDQITEKNFKPTARDLGSLIAPAYAVLADMYMGWYGNVDVAQEEPADVLVTPERINGWWDGGVYYRQHTHSWTLNSYTFRHTWSNCFSSINNVNRVIYQIESGTIPVTSDSLKTGILAVPYDAVYLPGSSFHMKTLKPELKYVCNMNAQPWGGSAANPQFVATYDPDDTRKQDTWLMGRHFTPDSAFGYDFTDTIPQF